MQKDILIIFSDHTTETDKTSEKLRLAVGLTLNDENILSLVFLGNSRNALKKTDKTESKNKPLLKHIEMLAELNAKFYVEEGTNFFITNNLDYQSIKSPEINDLIIKAGVVIH